MNLLMISLSACKFTYIVHSVHLIHLVHLVHVVCLSTLIFVFTLWGMWIEISEMEEKPNLRVSNVAQHSPGKVFPATFRRVWSGDSIDWSDSKCSLIQIPCLKMIECSECRFLCSKFSAEIVSPRLEILLNCFFFVFEAGCEQRFNDQWSSRHTEKRKRRMPQALSLAVTQARHKLLSASNLQKVLKCCCPCEAVERSWSLSSLQLCQLLQRILFALISQVGHF